MRYAKIHELDVSNGEGIGVALFVQGCHFHCKNCFNEETWDFDKGKEWDCHIENLFINYLIDRPYITRVSILGGEPLANKNLYDVFNLVFKIKKKFGDTKKIWLYTGYTFEEIYTKAKYIIQEHKLQLNKNGEEFDIARFNILYNIDVLVDGQYIDALKDISLKFRGSSNQNIINVKKLLKEKNIYMEEREEDIMETTDFIKKVDDSGRVLIPKEIRKQLEIEKGMDVEFLIQNNKVIIQKYDKNKVKEREEQIMQTKVVFEKVSFKQFMKDWIKIFPEDEKDIQYVRAVYDNIKLPKRSTNKSAGYDFYLPEDITFIDNSEQLIPTGIRLTNMADDEVLLIFPRSGLGSKYRFVLANLIAVIDADYADSDNEGHIFINMVNDGDKKIELNRGNAFCQGIITKFGVTIDDAVDKVRNGGFGSTDA